MRSKRSALRNTSSTACSRMQDAFQLHLDLKRELLTMAWLERKRWDRASPSNSYSFLLTRPIAGCMSRWLKRNKRSLSKSNT